MKGFKTWAAVFAGAAALPAVSGIARVETLPARPVRIIVGFGGAIDLRRQRADLANELRD